MNQTVSRRLDGRVAVVTGGSRGIGRAIATKLAAMGAHVVVNYVRDARAADATVLEIGSGSARLADVGSLEQADCALGDGPARKWAARHRRLQCGNYARFTDHRHDSRRLVEGSPYQS